MLALRGQTDEIADGLSRLSVDTILLASVAVVAGLLAAALSWRAVRVLMIVGDFVVVGVAVLSARVHARRAAAGRPPTA